MHADPCSDRATWVFDVRWVVSGRYTVLLIAVRPAVMEPEPVLTLAIVSASVAPGHTFVSCNHDRARWPAFAVGRVHAYTVSSARAAQRFRNTVPSTVRCHRRPPSLPLPSGAVGSTS